VQGEGRVGVLPPTQSAVANNQLFCDRRSIRAYCPAPATNTTTPTTPGTQTKSETRLATKNAQPASDPE